MKTKETNRWIRNKNLKASSCLAAAAILAIASNPLPASAAVQNGWETVDGKQYWYENGIRQGYDPDNSAYRGKEIYDKGTDAWYWLDSVQQGAKAVSKDVYQESQADDSGTTGKWVRYDADGHMIKGWYYTDNGIYYFDLTYGTMYKGYKTIDGVTYYFDENTGITDRDPVSGQNGWVTIEGKQYWYENGIRQGYDPSNPSYRGKEIYDQDSDAWYWLDNIQQGAKTVSKDVYQESAAGQWADNAENGTGKWVRYDAEGTALIISILLSARWQKELSPLMESSMNSIIIPAYCYRQMSRHRQISFPEIHIYSTLTVRRSIFLMDATL